VLKCGAAVAEAQATVAVILVLQAAQEVIQEKLLMLQLDKLTDFVQLVQRIVQMIDMLAVLDIQLTFMAKLKPLTWHVQVEAK
jgi:hypothetical protein